MNYKIASSLQGKNILILGLGISGRAAAGFLSQQKAHLFGVDDKSETLNLKDFPSLTLLSPQKALNAVSHMDIIIVSPGIPKTHPCYLKAQSCGLKIMGEAELAGSLLADKICIGITGTNGKTSVTFLIEHILNCQGFLAKAVGNCGLPLTDMLASDQNKQAYSHFVIELSSYQLETFTAKVLDAALVLNVTPDHLERYCDMGEYASTKFGIFNCLKPHGKSYVEKDTFKKWQPKFTLSNLMTYGYEPNCTIYTDLNAVYVERKRLFDLPLQLKGKKSPDLENTLAAFALVRHYDIAPKDFLSAWASFKKPPHRIEFVAEVKGVRYVDDSKGTNIDAVCRAVEAMPFYVILIAGGVDKGFSYASWITSFKGKVQAIIAIGKAATKIACELSPAIAVYLEPNLEAAVKHAASIARPGDTVLLSPGCASFDQFKDYAHRGLEFKKIVNKLAADTKESFSQN